MRHPFLMSGVRLAAGVWLLFISAALLSIGDWVGAAVVIPAGILLAVGAYVLTTLAPNRVRRTPR